MSEAVITIPGYGEVIGYEALTATGTKAALTATKYIKQADVAAGHMQRPMTARVAVISLSVANIRWTSDGTAPVAATTGHTLIAGQTLILEGAGKIAKFQFIAVSGSPVLDCLYTL